MKSYYTKGDDKMPKPRKDLTGQKFNKLRVLEYDDEYTLKHGVTPYGTKLYWKCQCDCGNITYAKTVDLTKGHKKSCGCLSIETSRQNMKKIQPLSAKKRLQNLEEQRFGKLTVLKRNSKNTSSGKPAWICKCDCGNIVVVAGEHLKRGDTQSCGCIGLSAGEKLIEEYLSTNNISFEKEYKFQDLQDKSYLRYDFAIFNKNNQLLGLIEYDGRQHSDITSIWYNEDLVRRDKMKTEYALNNNIPLLRISYKEKGNIEILLRMWLITLLDTKD